jgi:cell fate (sporulation/competence/biofilm development) regulator YlbF (YheA/YmcA/DUF963 family)
MQRESMGTMVGVNEAEALLAAREFAAALAETPEYEDFDLAQTRLRLDVEAQGAIRAFQQRQQSLQVAVRLGALSDADRDELQHLQQQMLGQPAVRSYVEAQERLGGLCQEAAKLISEVIGVSFAASCGPGCC